jgi:serine/threonine-protein kinase RsbT
MNSSQHRLFRFSVATDDDLLEARQFARTYALELCFSVPQIVAIISAISEMGRNMLLFAGHGELEIRRLQGAVKQGIEIRARDKGPGIKDLQKVLLDGYSTSGRLGMGLSAIRRLMDNFKISSDQEKGTTVIAAKWLEGE